MREILFRGKRIDSDVWVCGDLITADWYSNEETYIVHLGQQCQVIPETVGQYTGSKDKNGNKIFEDDILKYINDDNEIVYLTVVFEECAFLINERGITEYDLLPTFECLGVEVAGNIHDNSELIKEAKQE